MENTEGTINSSNALVANTYSVGANKLVLAVQELSMARSLEAIMLIVRRVARELTGADGATFVLRDGEYCFYAEEDAISPLWKGNRFPLQTCISGWTMLNKQAVIVEDIYTDNRIPHDTYRPTFVKSLAMVPIRTIAPIGAIGNYWARNHAPTTEELSLLQSLADITAVSIENVDMYNQLEDKLAERNQMLTQLTDQKQQLEEFCQIIAHNMRAPLSNLLLLGDMIKEAKDVDDKLMFLDKQMPVIDYLNGMFDNLVDAMQVRMDFNVDKKEIDIEQTVLKTLSLLQGEIIESGAVLTYDFSEAKTIHYSPTYFDSLVFNLVSNAIKFRSPERGLKINVKTYKKDGLTFLEVEDNGLGIDLNKHGNNLFKLRKTFHQHPNSKGFGLFITKNQIEAMGGKIWASSVPNENTVFTIQINSNVR
ncbi:MAG: GAF domain-containing sensor histidine kinase [Sphingobacteriales bacterium JAD_PAG50586_3]|nr:MAG: GAF domain-containing sensor histidine kinase [Sphingobacteriales bacterium JAD_PAG50586_3]